MKRRGRGRERGREREGGGRWRILAGRETAIIREIFEAINPQNLQKRNLKKR